ncbi:MAG: TatD family hydrolase, partial [Candidatus Kerfeldbacteria bacterium]|nr:TatD family hydrolase [Candidatus Kerfeldbacteria bacterium]
AVGETGLDAWQFKGRGDLPAVLKAQETLLLQHIDLAARHDLALMLHCRDAPRLRSGQAYNSLLDILRSYGRTFRGQIHCFMGTWEQAQDFMDLGLNVGFTGVITFPENTELRAVVRQVPLDRLHIETDAPYLSPEPHRRERNLPWYVEYTAKAVSELKGIPFDEVIHATAANTGRTYRFRETQADS